MYTLSFEALHEYDAGLTGITVPVELSAGENSVKVTAKLEMKAGRHFSTREVLKHCGKRGIANSSSPLFTNPRGLLKLIFSC